MGTRTDQDNGIIGGTTYAAGNGRTTWAITVTAVFAGGREERGPSQYRTLDIGDVIPGLGTVTNIVDQGYGEMLIITNYRTEITCRNFDMVYVQASPAEIADYRAALRELRA